MTELLKAISEVLATARPEENTEDMDAIVPAASWRRLVDIHAQMLYAQNKANAALQRIKAAYEARSELYTNDADCAGNLYDIACNALSQSAPVEGDKVSIPKEPDDGTLLAMWSAYQSAYESPMSRVYAAIVACFTQPNPKQGEEG